MLVRLGTIGAGLTTLTTSAAAGRGLDAATLYERYGQQLYRYCLGRLRDREEAADAVQNTFLRVHVALEKGVVPQFESAWLYKIAHNVCLSRIDAAGRRARVETPRDLDDHDLEVALAVPQSEHEALDGLADALAALPHNLRQAILLREWQGLSYAEIAEAMDTTVPAVETLLYRARRQLAAVLEAGGTRLRAALGGLLDLVGVRGLLTRGSTFLSGAGAAKVAVGAALLIAGGSGFGAAIALTERGTPHPGSQQTTPAGVSAGPVSVPRAQAPAAPAALPLSTAGRAPRGRSQPASTAATSPAAEPATAGGAPAASSQAAPAAAPPATAAARPAASPAPASVRAQAPALPATTAVSAPAVTTPELTAPALSAPSLSAPDLTAPTPSVPSATAPSVTAPAPTVPTVTAPTATTPPLTPPAAPVTAPTPTAAASAAVPSVSVPGFGG